MDYLSAILGSMLTKLTIVGSVLVGMKLAIDGNLWLAAGVLIPLALVVYLFLSDGVPLQ